METDSGVSASKQINQNDRKTVHAWAMYDWANSAYALVIVSAIFPAYYNEITTVDGNSKINLFGLHIENTAAYSINLGIAFGLIALLSPLLSSISDYSGNQRSFMKFFCYLGAFGCMSLFFFSNVALVHLALAGMLLATIGYSGSIVFYNSYLPAIATRERQDKVSARGYAYGYIGATTLLILNLAFILNQKKLGIADDTLLPRLSFLLTGLWWLGFAQIPLRKLPQGLHTSNTGGKNLMNGYRELNKIWHQLRTQGRLKTFLFSFFFYIMGVQTVMFMASSFGDKEIHLGLTELIITVLALEYIGVGGAFLFAWISKKIGNVRALMIAVGLWIMICAGAYLIITPLHFYITAFFIGLVMGGIQSLSRSTYGKMIPETGNNAGYFSFYDVCEKTAMMCGLVMFGSLDSLTGSMRNSIFALALWFFMGLVLLWRVQKMGIRPPAVMILLIIMMMSYGSVKAQPYVDPIQVRYMQAFRSKNTPATPFTHLYMGSDLPIRMKSGAILLISPYYDQWSIDSAETEMIYPTVHSLALPVGIILPIKDTRWTLTALPFIRTNGEELFGDRTFQFGGAALAGFERRPKQKFRFGVYASGEFFGLFIIPLLGVDWRIDERNYLFGVLPGRLTFEHQWNERFYAGATFRAPTTSYRLADGSFIRLDDNQLSIYLDYYITKHICVTVEPGYGLIRRIRTGVDTKEYLTKVNWGDGPFIKLSAGYRIRFEK